jgi:hypothetical protein
MRWPWYWNEAMRKPYATALAFARQAPTFAAAGERAKS